ncbi:hypothetical protein [Corynebacterium mastitidis]|uniref:hypothetical protein n=1 Tax=Corynebacterium mastitidis TaxID=161890 RepID=UPI00036767FA|nr:hypothetical protein [Corynebacterium mastitidis]
MPSSSSFRAAVAWWCSRVALLLYAAHQPVPRGDVAYYFRGLEAEAGGERALTEYPDASVIPLRALHALVGSDHQSLAVALMVLLLSLDALFCYALARRRAWWAYGFWLLFGLALAPLFTRRLDLLPGLAVGAAALWLARSPRLSSGLLALATALKLWPLALASGLVGRARAAGTWIRLAWFGGTLAGLLALSGLTQGWWRVVSPLTYQDERGLQSEAIAATPLLWLRAINPGRWDIRYAASQSYEVFGSGVGAGLAVATGLTAATALLIAGVTLRRFLRAAPLPPSESAAPAESAAGAAREAGYRPATTRALWLLTALLIIVSAKVFSPQYLLWVGPLVAVMLALDPSRALRWCAALLLGAAALTSLVYPVFFDAFLASEPGIVAVASARNLLIVAAAGCAAACAWRELRAEKTPPGR